MKNILLLGLGLVSLTACHPFGPPKPAGPSLWVSLGPAVRERCETVRWSDSTWVWASDTQLPGYSLWILNYESWGSVSDFDQKNIVLRGGNYRLINTAQPTVTLDSTFTCTKTGEVLKAAYTFPNTASSAQIILDVKDGHFTGQWEPVLPPA